MPRERGPTAAAAPGLCCRSQLSRLSTSRIRSQTMCKVMQRSMQADSSFQTSELAPSLAPAWAGASLLFQEEEEKIERDRKKKKRQQLAEEVCYTAHRQLRCNERLASERVQQGRTRGCQPAPHKRLDWDERTEADNQCPPKQRCVRPRMAPNSSKVHGQAAGRTVADRACDSL